MWTVHRFNHYDRCYKKVVNNKDSNQDAEKIVLLPRFVNTQSPQFEGYPNFSYRFSRQEVNKARVCLVLSRGCDNAMLTGGKSGY